MSGNKVVPANSTLLSKNIDYKPGRSAMRIRRIQCAPSA
jgi:hypothetical protein